MPLAEETPAPAKQPSNSGHDAYASHVNPEWVRLLDLLGMNMRYTRCQGAEPMQRTAASFWTSSPATASTTQATTTRRSSPR